MQLLRYVGSKVIFRLLLPLLTAIALLSPLPSAWALMQIASPETPPRQGEAITLLLELTEIEPAGGTLFYRPSGTGYYQRVPFKTAGAGVVNILLPPEAIVAPGIDYYVEITDVSGRTVTSPEATPRLTPHTLSVRDGSHSMEVRLLSPETDSPVEGNILTLLIEVHGAERPLSGRWVTLLLDDTDITPLADFSGERVSYTTEIIPDAGEHTVSAVIEGRDGLIKRHSWNFTILNRARPSLP
ncbi:MAG: hypothetical protein ACE5D4_05775 [Thermodesulfobacteriota bacterium]